MPKIHYWFKDSVGAWGDTCMSIYGLVYDVIVISWVHSSRILNCITLILFVGDGQLF